MKKMRISKKGFTLTEIVLVIAVIVILSSASVIGIAATMNKAKTAELKLQAENLPGIKPGTACVTASARKPETLNSLKDELRLYAAVSDQAALTQPRQLDAARRAAGHLKDALMTLDTFTPDMASTDLQAAQEALSEITGDRADEKLLDSVFSQFCVGK